MAISLTWGQGESTCIDVTSLQTRQSQPEADYDEDAAGQHNGYFLETLNLVERPAGFLGAEHEGDCDDIDGEVTTPSQSAEPRAIHSALMTAGPGVGSPPHRRRKRNHPVRSRDAKHRPISPIQSSYSALGRPPRRF